MRCQNVLCTFHLWFYAVLTVFVISSYSFVLSFDLNFFSSLSRACEEERHDYAARRCPAPLLSFLAMPGMRMASAVASHDACEHATSQRGRLCSHAHLTRTGTASGSEPHTATILTYPADQSRQVPGGGNGLTSALKRIIYQPAHRLGSNHCGENT